MENTIENANITGNKTIIHEAMNDDAIFLFTLVPYMEEKKLNWSVNVLTQNQEFKN